jgi:hypothetical protein
MIATMDHALSVAAAIPIDAGGAIDADLRCTGCGYNLRKTRPEASCPECGEAVAESLRPDLLRFAPRGHVTVLKAGVICGLAAVGLQVLMMIALAVIVGVAGGGGMWVVYVEALWTLPGYVLVLIATFCLTARSPGGRLTPAAGIARWVMLVAVIGGAAVSVGKVIMYASVYDNVLRLGLTVGEFVMALLWAGAVAALAVHVARVAGRIPDRRLGRRVRWAGGALVVSGAVLATVQLAFVLYFEFLMSGGMPGDDPLFVVLQIAGMAVSVVWLASIICCIVIAVIFLLRLRRVYVMA